MKKILLFIVSTLVGIALFIGVVLYIGTDEIVRVFSSFSWEILLVVIGLGLLQIAITIYRWQRVLAAQGDHVTFRDLLAPKFVGFAISFITPGPYVGGEPIRAYLLKRKTKIRLSRGMASIIVDKILDFTYPLPFLIGALIYAMFTYQISWEAISVFVATLFILVVLLGLFYVQTYRGIGFFSSFLKFFRIHRFKRLSKFFEKMLYFESIIIQFFQRRPRIFIEGLLLSLLGGIVIFIQFMVVLHALNISGHFLDILVMMVFMILSFLIPIPASLGSFEASQAIVFRALGYTPSLGVAFTMVLRAADFVKVAIGLIFLSNVGLKFLKDVPANGETTKSELPGEPSSRILEQ